MDRILINQPTANDTLNIALDTISIGKQALVFLGTKPSAEKTAEDISKKNNSSSAELEKLSLDVFHSLSKPTKQCERLAACVRKGIAFHHSGLTNSQRTSIENAFKKGLIRIICCTPTLAAGVDLPAFRAIIRDLRRFGDNGMGWIPVLEYLQMSGRAGRPKYDTEGQAIIIAGSDKDEIFEKYILGEPESIFSKLAAEPALRTYLLSLVSTRFIQTMPGMFEFFSRTFWAHQYGDMEKLNMTLLKILAMLRAWSFVKEADDFVSADQKEEHISSTILGKRVAELYLDPLTAHHIISCMEKASDLKYPFPWLLMISTCLEMRPLLRAGSRDFDELEAVLIRNEGRILQEEPSMYEDEYYDFMSAVKTASFLSEWIEEKDEEFLLEKFKVRPGEIHAKLDKADWLLFSATELAKLLQMKDISRELMKIRTRVRYGAKEELFPLLRLKGIGRVRARKLFSKGITDLGAIRRAEMSILSGIVGQKIAMEIKEQVGDMPKDNQQVLDNSGGQDA